MVHVGLRAIDSRLRALQEEMRAHALECGLDFFDTVFEMVDFKTMNEIAAYGGFPVRYPHYSFGEEYHRLSRSYAYGLHRIYELVINNDPCYAYLLDSNQFVDHKLVMGHVYAHCDFFKNNLWFAHTNRKMVDEMANHGQRIRSYADRYGHEKIEEFIDVCKSVDSLIDPHSICIQRRAPESHALARADLLRERHEDEQEVGRLRVDRGYMSSFLNPPSYIEDEKARIQKEQQETARIPEHPEADVLLFLLEHAPLVGWQADILSMFREESYYFAPQTQTKIMNEGWATYWHSHIMTTMAATDADIIDYADHHAGTVHAHFGRVNPYRLGYLLFQDIKERWDKGQFGPDYDRCEDISAKRRWDMHLGAGREKIFEIRRTHNDVGFIDEFLTREFCARHEFFVYAYDRRDQDYKIVSREFEAVKQELLFSLTNAGRPRIFVSDANYRNRGELYLTHEHEGIGLDLGYAIATLKHLTMLWSRPAHISTISADGKDIVISHDGEEYRVKKNVSE